MYFIDYSNLIDLEYTCDFIESLNKSTNLISSISELTESFYLSCLHCMYLNKKTYIYLIFDEEKKKIYTSCKIDSIFSAKRICDNNIRSFIREFFRNDVPPTLYTYPSIECVFDDLKESSLINIYNLIINGTVEKDNYCDVVIDKKNRKIEITEKKSTNFFAPDVIIAGDGDTIYYNRDKYY